MSNPYAKLDEKHDSAKDAEVQRVKAEILEKDKQIHNLQSELEKKTDEQKQIGKLAPNWPKCKPIIYHNIDEDFPEEVKKKLMKRAYFCWFLNVFCCTWNMLCLFMAMFEPKLTTFTSVVSDFVGSLIFCVLWVPLSFMLWYRMLYKAIKQSKSSLFIIFFGFFFVQILLCILDAIGLWSSAAAGVVSTIDVFTQGAIGVGICFAISTVAWVLLTFLCVYIMRKVYSEFQTGGSIVKAKGELQAEFGSGIVDLAKANITQSLANNKS